MGRERDEMLQAAEAEVSRIGEVLVKLEADRAAAQERLNQIPDEPPDTLSRRLGLADQQYDRIEEKIAEVEDDFRRAQMDFDALEAQLDDVNSDGDSMERLSVWDAKDIWLSSGVDEDKMFGYTADELRRAAEE